MNYISYALFGDSPKYLNGALFNATDVLDKYPTFQPVFFVDSKTVPGATLRALRELPVRLIAGNTKWMPNKTNWQTTAFDLPNAETVIFRDVDSRVTRREVAAVTQWMETDFGAHVMRDFPAHTDPLMGGMWGLKKRSFPKLNLGKVWQDYRSRVSDWDNPSDQVFLKRAVWPLIKHDILQHDEFTGAPGTYMFPVPFDPAEGFVGEIYTAEGIRIPEHSAFRGIAPFGPIPDHKK